MAHRSLSFSEYSDHYEHQRAGTRIRGYVRDAAPTVLDWEIGSLPAHEDFHRESVREHVDPTAAIDQGLPPDGPRLARRRSAQREANNGDR